MRRVISAGLELTGFKTVDVPEARASRGISLDDPWENPGIHGAETPQENTASARDTPPAASAITS